MGERKLAAIEQVRVRVRVRMCVCVCVYVCVGALARRLSFPLSVRQGTPIIMCISAHTHTNTHTHTHTQDKGHEMLSLRTELAERNQEAKTREQKLDEVGVMRV